MVSKVYVVEDMAISRAALISTLEDNDFEVVGSSASGDKAWIEIKDLDVDIALLDINLVGERDGVWLAKMIRNYKNMPIIFLTAYGDEKTLNEIREVEPNGYLMKPFNAPTLVTLIDIASRSFRKSEQHKNFKDESTPTVIIKEGSDLLNIKISQIQYFKSEGNYLEVAVHGRKHITREKLVDFLEQISNKDFVQVHRRYAVNLNCVTKISTSTIFIESVEIPISRSFKETLSKAFAKRG